ncbi:zinc finger BED domain-containing protein RICESLEEPER 2-like [Chenopodium quinoa]|uniref:zinc finger BED domain-containing protein RICESLEEPER 2-like n=1 Tax=Chenopodium quinoa TaxID=63459 RepID=UPI000B786768|nr:zinc finger BED domain-containing protein RICESLEEPER 2-like [Chenopodium quinoa]
MVHMLPSKTLKRPADEASSESVKKQRAVDDEPKFNAVLDEGHSISKQPCQPTTPEDEIQSRMESHNLECSVESLQSIDYYDSEMSIHDVDAERLVTIQKFTFDPVLLRKELAKMIILHEHPLSMVEQIGFRDFLCKVNPSFGMLSQNTIENDIMNIFKFERCMTYTDLGDNSSGCGVAITTKMWTSNDGNRRFLAITGHFIDDEWKRQSYILRFANVPLPCTNESISKVILDCFSYFDVIKKLSTITVDSYTCDDKLVDILMEKLPGNKLLFKEKLFRLPCFSHTMSLMVQDGLDLVRRVIEKIRDSIVFWTSSPEREMTFEKAACELGVSTTSKLVLDDGLNWSSTYFMLQDSFVVRDVFSLLRQQESHYDSLPTEEEWDLVMEVCNRLQFLYNETKYLANCPAACFYIMHLCYIKETLTEWLDCEAPGIKNMASMMVKKLDQYFFATHDILGVVSVFHPKYRFFSVEHFFSVIYRNEAEGVVERIRRMFYDLFNQYKNSHPVEKSSNEGLSLLELRQNPAEFTFERYLREMKKKEPELYEVDLYLKEYFDPETKNFDILSWWNNRKTRYPVLHKIAKDVLSIPIFSVNVANAFDIGDKILGANRSRLRPTMVEALMCTQSWIRRRKNLNS